MKKNILSTTITFLFFILSCDLYFPPSSFDSPVSEPTLTPTFPPAPTAIPTPSIPPDGNLLYNHDFSNGLDSWTFWSNESAGADVTVQEVAGEVLLAIVDGSNERWHIQLQQKFLYIMNQQSYHLSFQARAAAARSIFVEIGEDGYDNNNDQNKYTFYGGFTPNLTTSMTLYELDFTMEEATDTQARLVFNFGNNNEDVWIDNVILTKNTP